MAHSGLSPDKKIVKTIKQLAMELREAKKPLVVDKRPIIARATEASPTKGERKALSSAVFQAKKGKKAAWTLSRNLLREKSGARRSSAMMVGLIKAAITRVARPAIMMKMVRMRGRVGRVLMVKRRWGWRKANNTMKIAR